MRGYGPLACEIEYSGIGTSVRIFFFFFSYYLDFGLGSVVAASWNFWTHSLILILTIALHLPHESFIIHYVNFLSKSLFENRSSRPPAPFFLLLPHLTLPDPLSQLPFLPVHSLPFPN